MWSLRRRTATKNVKRVIGLPGETIEIRGGFLFINGEILYAENDLEQVSLAGRAEHPIVLGEDEYFLLGDNRDRQRGQPVPQYWKCEGR